MANISSGFGTVVCLFVLATCSVAAKRWVPPLQCSMPPEGQWLVQHDSPASYDNNTLLLTGSSVLDLKREYTDCYSGAGAGITLRDVGTLPAGTAVAHNIWAIFNPVTCTLSGTIYAFGEISIAMPFEWRFDGDKYMEGPFVDAVGTTLLYQTLSRHRLTYFGPSSA